MKKILTLITCGAVLLILSVSGIPVFAAETNDQQVTLQEIENENHVQYDTTHSIQPRLNGGEFMVPPRRHGKLPSPYKFLKCMGGLAIAAASDGSLWSYAGSAWGCLP